MRVFEGARGHACGPPPPPPPRAAAAGGDDDDNDDNDTGVKREPLAGDNDDGTAADDGGGGAGAAAQHIGGAALGVLSWLEQLNASLDCYFVFSRERIVDLRALLLSDGATNALPAPPSAVKVEGKKGRKRGSDATAQPAPPAVGAAATTPSQLFTRMRTFVDRYFDDGSGFGGGAAGGGAARRGDRGHGGDGGADEGEADDVDDALVPLPDERERLRRARAAIISRVFDVVALVLQARHTIV